MCFLFVAIDAPGGFLFEWWSVFWDIFIARTNEKHSDVAASYIEVENWSHVLNLHVESVFKTTWIIQLGIVFSLLRYNELKWKTHDYFIIVDSTNQI